MQKIYSRIDWENEPSTNTPLSESNLNKMDYALDQIDNRVVQLAGYQDRVSQSEKNAKTSEENAKVSEINAKESEEKAKEYMESAFNGTPEGYQEVVEKVDRMEIKTTKENTIKGTKNGGFRLTNVKANTIQNGTPSPITPFPLLSTGDCVEMIQGKYAWGTGKFATDVNYICTKNHIPCVSNDSIVVSTENTISTIGIIWFNEKNEYVSETINYGISQTTITAQSNATSFVINLGLLDITPDTAGKITITINGKYLGCAKTHSKNLLNVTATTQTINGITFTVNKDKSVTVKGTATANAQLQLGMVTLDGEFVLSGGTGSLSTYELFISDDANYLAHDTGSGAYFSCSNKMCYAKILVRSGVTVNATFYPMIRKADITDDTYEPYKETIAYFLTDYPMIKGSTLFRENGLVKAKHEGSIVTLSPHNSVIGGVDESGKAVYYSTQIDNLAIDSDDNCLCTHFVRGSNNIGEFRVGGGTYKLSFIVDGTQLPTIESFKAWLNENNVEVKCILKTPIIETLDTASQIALNGLETFEGVTIVEFDTRVQPLEFEAEVGTSQMTARLLKEELRNDTDQVERAELKKRLDELAVAIVALRS